VAGAFVAFNFLAKPDFHATSAGAQALALKAPFILLRPLGLGDYYDFSWPALAVVLALAGGSVVVLRRTIALPGLLWVVVCTAPLVALDKLSSRYLYLMSIGYALALCGIVPWLADRLRGGPARRLAGFASASGLVAVLAANLVFIQREIADYAVLARPYGACIEALAPHLSALGAGETVVVVDIGPHDAIPVLARAIAERGNMNKLIPYRARGIDGLIELPDLVNTVRREPGLLGREVGLPPAGGGLRFVVYDGTRAASAGGLPEGTPPDRVHAVRLEDPALYFRDRSTRRGG
jgi:hypothetical protein